MIVLGIFAIVVLACFGFITFVGAPYVPTHRRQIAKVFDEAYEVTPGDLVVDLGSGDGVLLRAVARRGGRALGIELNPILASLSALLSVRYTGLVTVRCRNLWTAPLPPETTLVYTFLDARFMPRLKRKLERHVKKTGRPLRYMSYGFKLPGATPDTETAAMFLYTIRPE